MADYASEKGVKVQTVAGDPPATFEGQVWYNSTTGSHRVSKGPLVTAWSTGGDLNTARFYLAGAGTQTSALAFDGDFAGPTESYNGTNWTEVNDINSGRRELAGTGADNTSALAFGGNLFPNPAPPPSFIQVANTESWNGTNWTEVNDLNTARYRLAAAGTQTAALGFGGRSLALSPDQVALTESWNGTNWTEVNDLNSQRDFLAGCGTQTSALGFGGEGPGLTESWNGTSWTEVNDINTARQQLAGAGTQTAALGFGGGPPVSALTESWNGTNWTEVNDLNLARRGLAGAGTQAAALAFGGFSTTASTEEWGETGGNFNITSS